MNDNIKTLLKTAGLFFLIIGFFVLFEVDVNFSYFQETGGQNQEVSQSESEPTSSETSLDILPTGTPDVYGAELGLEYGDVSMDDPVGADRAIEEMAMLDMEIDLEEDNLERYISILYEKEGGISCEYCCGAQSIIFEDGEPACGCAHSFAMRGIAKYLITEHGEDLSDEEILEEVGKWKVLFFPEIHQQKADALEEEGLSTDYVTLTTNTYRGIEEGSQGGMVGGC